MHHFAFSYKQFQLLRIPVWLFFVQIGTESRITCIVTMWITTYLTCNGGSTVCSTFAVGRKLNGRHDCRIVCAACCYCMITALVFVPVYCGFLCPIRQPDGGPNWLDVRDIESENTSETNNKEEREKLSVCLVINPFIWYSNQYSSCQNSQKKKSTIYGRHSICLTTTRVVGAVHIYGIIASWQCPRSS